MTRDGRGPGTAGPAAPLGVGVEVTPDGVRATAARADGRLRAIGARAISSPDDLTAIADAIGALVASVPGPTAVRLAIADPDARVERVVLDDRGAAGIAPLLRQAADAAADVLTVVDEPERGPVAFTIHWDAARVERLATTLGPAVPAEPSAVASARAGLDDAAAAAALAAAGAVPVRPLRPLRGSPTNAVRLVVERLADDHAPPPPAPRRRWWRSAGGLAGALRSRRYRRRACVS